MSVLFSILGGVIQLDEVLPDLARITIEQKANKPSSGNHYAINIVVHNMLVHTAFF